MSALTHAQGLAQNNTQQPLIEDNPVEDNTVDNPVEDPGIPEVHPTPSVHDEDNNTPADVEGRRFAKILASALSGAIAQALIASKATAAPDPTKYPKAKDPGMFNGRRRHYLRTWIGENEICFRTAPNLYRAETSKVMFAGSFLEGDAKLWFTDYFHDPTNIPAFLSDWTLFTIELQHNFGLEDELGAAEEDMRNLSMTNKDHASYFTARFRAIMTNLSGSWDDRNLRNHYYQKLAPRLQAQFVSAGSTVPPTLEPLITKVDRFDRAYWSDYELSKAMGSSPAASEKRTPVATLPTKLTNNTPPSIAPAASSNRSTVAKPFPAAHLTKEGKLTPDEKQCRMNIGACFYCGEVGHLTAQCPKKGVPRARAAVTNISAVPPATARASIVVLEDSEESGKD